MTVLSDADLSPPVHTLPPRGEARDYEEIGSVADDGWLARRLTGVGASEAAVLLGVHPKFEGGGPACLWSAKTGRQPLDYGFGDNGELAHWGHVLEPVVIAQFASPRYAGWPSEPSGQHLRSIAEPWALATIDGWTTHPTLGRIPLEAKTVQPWIADQWEDSAPTAYWWQVQHQLLVTGARAGAIAALVAGGHLMWELIERDERAQRKLAAAGREFWRCVLEDRVPLHVPTLQSVRALYPPGAESGAVQLSGAEWLDADRRIAEIKWQEKALRTEREVLEARLKDAIGKHAEASLDDGTVWTLKTQTRAESTIKASEFRVLRRKARKG